MIQLWLTITQALGLSALKIKVGIIILLCSFVTYKGTLFFSEKADETAKLNRIAESLERLELKLDDKFNAFDERFVLLEIAVSDLSVFGEKSSKENLDFLKAYVQDNTKLAYMYKERLERIEELQKDYLPTRKGFKIGVKPIELDKTN